MADSNSEVGEIDLSTLAKNFGELIFRIWKSIIILVLGTIDYTKKYWYVIAVSIIFLTSWQLKSYFQVGQVYSSSMLLNSEYLKGDLLHGIVDALNESSVDTPLSDKLKIPDSTANKILKFEVSPIATNEDVLEVELLRQDLRALRMDGQKANLLLNRISLDVNLFEIKIQVSDPSAIVAIEEPVLNYIRSTPYLSKRLEIERQNRLAEINKLDRELSKLDSLKANYINYIGSIGLSGSAASGNLIVAEENAQRPISIFNEDIRLFERKLAIEELLELEPEFEVIEGLNTYTAEKSKNLEAGLLTGLSYGLILGYGILALISVSQYLKSFRRKYV